MEEKKNQKGLIWLIIILIVLVLGLVGYIVYDKLLLNNKTSVNNGSAIMKTKVSSEEKNAYIIKETKTSKNGIEVILEQKTIDDNCYLIIGNNKITLTDSYCADGAIDLYDDFLIVYAFNPVTSNDHFDTFDYNGIKLFDKEDLIVDENEYLNKTSEKYNHYYYISRTNYEVIGNKVIYSIGYSSDSCYIQGADASPDNCSMSNFKCSDLYDLGDNINYTSTYEIELINNKLSTPKLISSTKLKDTDVYRKALNNCE